MPPAPVMAVVDIEAGTVSGTSPLLDGIVSYQIWEADGSLCIADASDPATAFKAVDGLHGTYMLRDDDRCRACLLLPVCAGGCPYARIIDMDKKTNKACPLNVTNLADYLWEHYLCKKSRKG